MQYNTNNIKDIKSFINIIIFFCYSFKIQKLERHTRKDVYNLSINDLLEKTEDINIYISISKNTKNDNIIEAEIVIITLDGYYIYFNLSINNFEKIKEIYNLKQKK